MITDRALIVKATRQDVQQQNSKNQVFMPLQFFYRIIPWKYFSMEHYELYQLESTKGEYRFLLAEKQTELAQFGSVALCNALLTEQELLSEQKNRSSAAVENIALSSGYLSHDYRTNITGTGRHVSRFTWRIFGWTGSQKSM